MLCKIQLLHYYEPETKLFGYLDQFDLDKVNSDYVICDEYEIDVYYLNGTDEYVAEANDRIKGLHEVGPDAHINADGTLCVAAKNSILYRDNCKGQDNFIEYLLKPFLYAHSFEEIHGSRPWPTRSHNEMGILEEYGEMSCEDKREQKSRTIAILSDYGLLKFDEETHRCLCGISINAAQAYEELFRK